MKRFQKVLTPEQAEEIRIKDFFDRILPSTVRFFPDHYVVGNYYCSVWALREYPPATEDQALLAHLADHSGVTLRIYHRLVEPAEQNRIIQNASRKNKVLSGDNNISVAVEAQGNLQDVVKMLADLRQNREPLLHCAVYIELRADSLDALRELQGDIGIELNRAKLSVDRLLLRQREGYLSVVPSGANQFGTQFERVLPASSAANLYPFNFSGKTDPRGIYVGRDRFGSSVLVDFDRRSEDKTNSVVLILGNPGQGKSYLMKLLLTNLREAGKKVIVLDAEGEYEDLANALGGCYLDFLSGKYLVNPLEPKAWTDGSEAASDKTAPEAFRRVTRLSQHIAFLKDFFRTYKDFTDAQIDTIEVILSKLYARWGITDSTDYSTLQATDYPTMSDLYALCEEEYKTFDSGRRHIYTEQTLQEICLGLHSICVGAESKYFNGHTNITDSMFLCYGVKGIENVNSRLRDTIHFNILSYMSNELLTKGNAMGSIDEFYLFLRNKVIVEYIRNMAKRARKRDSGLVMATQNVEDVMLPGIREYTKPLFAIPSHQFLFYPGAVNTKDFCDALQLEPSEFELIRFPARGTCLFRCGNERYLLEVTAPDYKKSLFGAGGGR